MFQQPSISNHILRKVFTPLKQARCILTDLHQFARTEFLNKYLSLTFTHGEPVQLEIFMSCFQLKNKSPLIPLSEINQKSVF